MCSESFRTLGLACKLGQNAPAMFEAMASVPVPKKQKRRDRPWLTVLVPSATKAGESQGGPSLVGHCCHLCS